jgi:predicted Zn-dependent protease
MSLRFRKTPLEPGVDRQLRSTFCGSKARRVWVAIALVVVLGLAGSDLLAQGADQEFSSLSAKATAARESGRTADALRAYRAALEIRPDWDEGWWYVGTLSYDADRFPEAIPALQHFVRLDPNVGAGWAFLGLSEFETAAFDAAFRHLERARTVGFKEDPDVEKVALYHLALLLNVRGNFEEASGLLTSSFGNGHFPDQIKTALALALLRVPLLPTQVDSARDALLHAAGNAADLIAHQNAEAAADALRQMLKDFPKTPYLHYALGTVLTDTSQFDAAEAEFHEEASVMPQSPMSSVGMSFLRLKQGRADDAVASARHGVQMDPESIEAQRALSEALRQDQKKDLAAAAAEQADRLASQPAKPNLGQTKFYAATHGGAIDDARRNDEANGKPGGATSSSKSFEAIAREATAAREAGRVVDATALYRSGVRMHPSWQEGWRQLGTLLYVQQNYKEAASALQQSVALEARQADTWTLLGLCEFETGDYKNALLHLKKGQALGFGANATGVRFARYHLALLLNLDGDFDPATDLLIPEARPGQLFEEIQFAMGLALLRMPVLPDQVEAGKRDLVRAAGRAAVLLSESRYDSAFPIFEKLLQDYPDTPFLHYAYGDALAATSDYDRAQAQLREETRLNPNSLVVYLRLAAIALRLKQPDSAMDSAKKAVHISQNSPDAHYLLGRSYLESGDTRSAIQELETARRLAPGSPAVHFNLARAYAKAERPDEARQERAEFQRLNAALSAQGVKHDSTEGMATEGGEALAPSIAK